MTDHDVVSFEDLRALASASGPCLTLATSIPNPAELSVRLKNGLRALADKVEDAALMEPVEKLAQSAHADQVWGNSLMLFRSPDLFQYYWLRGSYREMALVGQHFQLRPLLSVLTGEQCFHVLALSRRKVRLFRCTPHAAEEIDLAAAAPVNLEEWLNIRQSDHVLDNHSSAGPSTGSMRGVMFGTITDREREDESLRHFFKEVDRGVKKLLRDDSHLILAGVDHEVASYRRVATYPFLLDEAVQGAPDGMSNHDLYLRAWEVARGAAPEAFRKAMEEAETHRERGQISTDTSQVIQAAFEGRVADLFLSDSAERRGSWDKESFKPRIGEGEDDLLNAAAVETIRHGGRAFEVDPRSMPVRDEVAAVLRF